jgi:hypothetical protein
MTESIRDNHNTEPKQEENDNYYNQLLLSSFTKRLDSFASTLPRRERLALAAIIMASMDPIERMRWHDHTKILDFNEIEILKKLQIEMGKPIRQ